MLASHNNKINKFIFKGVSILRSLPREETKWILANSKEKKIRASAEIFREGTFPKQIFILKKGKVKIYQTTVEGDEQIVYIYTPGDIFGYRAILCNEKHPVTARALEESTLLVMSSAKFQEFLKRSSALPHILLKNLSSEFSVWINLITTFAQYSVRERLALSLLLLAEKYGKSKETGQSEINLMRRDLASFVGTSIETLARMLTKWKNEKLITSKGRRIIIKNPAQLAKIID